MNSSKIYVKLLRWAIFASLFLPLIIFKNYLSPFHFGKMVVFRSLVQAMAVLYLLLVVSNKKYLPRFFSKQSGWVTIPTVLSIFTGFYTLTSLTAVDLNYAFWGTLERMGGLFSFLHLWVFFIILISIFDNREDWEKLLKVSIFVGFLSILFSFGQYFKLGNFFIGWQHGDRVIGTIGNPALFAGYLLFILFLCLYFLLKKDSPVSFGVSSKEKGFYASVFILGTLVLLITAVRGSVIAFLASLVLLALFYLFFGSSLPTADFPQGNKKIKKQLAVGIIIFLALVVFVFLNNGQAWVKNIGWLNRITSISWHTTTVQTRLWAWSSGIEGWKERPWLGWGPENFVLAHAEHFNPHHFTGLGSETIWDRAHNIIIEMLTTMGVFGLISYLSIFLVLLYLFWKGYQKSQLDVITVGVFGAMLVAYFIHNLFIFDTIVNYFLFFLILGYLNFRFNEDTIKQSKVQIAESEWRNPSPFLIVVLILLAIISIYKTNIEPVRANYSATRAILIGRSGNAQKALAKYKEALSYQSPQGKYEIRHKLAAFVIQYNESLFKKEGKIDKESIAYAINEVEGNIKDHPLDYIPNLYIARMYILLIPKEGQVAGEKAESFIKKALAINDKNPRVWYELGQARLSQKKADVAIEAFQSALALNTEVKESNWFLGMAYLKADEEVQAKKYVSKAIELGYNYKKSMRDLGPLINLYGSLGDYPRVIDLYKSAINLQPKNPQLYASLATAYKAIGDIQNAILYAQKATEINPEKYKAKSDAFIKSLK